MAVKILVVDADPTVQRALSNALAQVGFEVIVSSEGTDALRLARSERPALVLVASNLAGLDGFTVVSRLRMEDGPSTHTPAILLLTENQPDARSKALRSGADDYLIKPFRQGELVARVKAAIRHRQRPEEKGAIVAGPVSIDLDARIVKRGGEIVKLTGTEYALLALFVRNAGRVLTHRYILEQVWGPSYAEESQYTRVYVGQLRKKLEDDPSNPSLIVTESGIGYRFAG